MLATGYSAVARKFLSLTIPSISHKLKLGTPILIGVLFVAGILLAWLPLKMAMVAVSGLIFGALALLRPTLILYVLIPVIPFSSMLAVPVGGANAGAMELLLLLAVAIWLFKILVSQSVTGRPAKIYTGPLLWPFLVFLGGIGLTWAGTFSIRASLVETIKWAEMFILYLFVYNLLAPKQIKWAVAFILLTGVTQAVLGLYQFIFKVGPEGFLLFGGQFLRAYGTFAQPNPYAGYLGLVLPLALSLTIWAFEASPKAAGVVWTTSAPAHWNKILKAVYFVFRVIMLSLPPAIMLAALFASQSRGAWLGFAVAAVVTIVVRSRKAAILLAVTVLVLALAGLGGAFY